MPSQHLNGHTTPQPLWPLELLQSWQRPEQQPFGRLFLRTLSRRKALLAVLFVLISGAVALATFLMPRQYQAEARLLLEQDIDTEKALLLGINAQASREQFDWIAAEIEIMRSAPVLQEVVRQTGLYQERLAAATRAGKTMSLPEVLDEAISRLQKKLEIENPRKSTILILTYEHEIPATAAAVVNSLLREYRVYRAKIYTNTETYKFLEQQMQLADQQLRELEREESNYRSAAGMYNPEAQVNLGLAKLGEYQKSLTETQTRRVGKEARIRFLREKFDAGDIVNLPLNEQGENPGRYNYINTLRSNLLQMQIERDRLLQKFTPAYEAVVSINQQIAATEANIRREIEKILQEEETAVRALAVQEEALKERLAAITSEIRAVSQKETQMTRLTRDLNSKKELYSVLLRQREEARISAAKAQHGVTVRVISDATPPLEPSKPDVPLNVGLGLLLGLFSAFSVALTREYLDTSVKSVEDIEERTDLAVLATVSNYKLPANGIHKLPKPGVGDRRQLRPQ